MLGTFLRTVRQTMAKRVFAVAAALSILIAAVPAAQSVPTAPRIQLGRYVDPVNKIDDPLNEIVEIRYFQGGDGFSGTGTFLKDCRIITALHVVLNMIHGKRTRFLRNPDPTMTESLVGEKFDFVTNPVPSIGGRVQRLVGSFVVIGHGQLLGGSNLGKADEDWVVGYDPECISDKHGLGFVTPVSGQRLKPMMLRDYYLTAGHSRFAASQNANGEYSLYVDAKCNVTDRRHISDDYVLTDCSLWDGGSGQLLMTPLRKNGVIQMGAGGQPIKLAHAMFQAMEHEIDVNAPNTKVASGAAPFTSNLYECVSKHSPRRFEIVPTDQGATEREKRFVHIRPAFVAKRQAPEAV